MVNVVQWYSRRVPWSYSMLIAEEETDSAGKKERSGRNRIREEIPPLFKTRLLLKNAWKRQN